jgi:5-hydroxyisourate hydrolase
MVEYLAFYGEGAGTELQVGRYRLEFDLDGYFDAMGLSSFLPEAVIGFEVADASQHFHVPLLLSPNGFSTYRGS